MTSPVLSQSTGVEEALDEIEVVLIRDINPALDEVYSRRVQSDKDRAERRQIPYVAIEYEEVPPSHFHTGNFPSLVLEEVPKDAYPYVVLTIDDYTADPADAQNDHMNVYRDAVVVHCLAKASPQEGSEVVFRRAVRMGEAVFLALASDSSMQKRLGGLSNPLRGQPSIPWTYQDKGRGKDWWYQAVGTSYAIRTYTSMYD